MSPRSLHEFLGLVIEGRVEKFDGSTKKGNSLMKSQTLQSAKVKPKDFDLTKNTLISKQQKPVPTESVKQ